MPEKYFDIKRDNELIKAGTHFWCEACLVARPLESQSLDSRYCQGCYDFLKTKAQILKDSGSRGHLGWIPRDAPKPKTRGEKLLDTQPPIPQIMATVAPPKTEVAIIDPRPPKRPVLKRGRKFREDLPFEVIMRLGKEMGSKGIASKLKSDYGIKVGFRTIARVLSGERNMEVKGE